VWNNIEKPFCIALQTYGAYLTDVGGDSGSVFFDPQMTWEPGFSFVKAGFADPLLTLVQTSVGTSHCANGFCGDGQTSAVFGYNAGYFQNGSGFNLHIMAMPGAINHLHIVDPCIP